MTTATTNMGLFPLNLVLLPGEQLPLHIFEDRYRALVADCTLEGRSFVLPLATSDGVAKYACSARVHRVEHRFADGRMNIVIRGGDRIEIIAQTDGEPYVTAEVRVIPDDVPQVEQDAIDRVTAQFRALATNLAGAPIEPPADPGVPLSYRIAGTMQLPNGTKQRLLEERSEAARLELVESIIGLALSEAEHT